MPRFLKIWLFKIRHLKEFIEIKTCECEVGHCERCISIGFYLEHRWEIEVEGHEDTLY